MAMTYPQEVAQGHREADGQGGAAQVVSAALVCGGKDAEHQLQGQEELHGHSLAGGRVVVKLGAERVGGETVNVLPALARLHAHLQPRPQRLWAGWEPGRLGSAAASVQTPDSFLLGRWPQDRGMDSKTPCGSPARGGKTDSMTH